MPQVHAKLQRQAQSAQAKQVVKRAAHLECSFHCQCGTLHEWTRLAPEAGLVTCRCWYLVVMRFVCNCRSWFGQVGLSHGHVVIQRSILLGPRHECPDSATSDEWFNLGIGMSSCVADFSSKLPPQLQLLLCSVTASTTPASAIHTPLELAVSPIVRTGFRAAKLRLDGFRGP